MDKRIQKLERDLHRDIPLTRAMGVCVAGYDGNSLVLEAPLSSNLNHKSTAFGGSLYSLAVLSGWGLLQLKLQDLGLEGHIVIYEGRISYRNPVTDDLSARCTLPDEVVFARFIRSFKRKGMASIELLAEISSAGRPSVSLQATYVVHTRVASRAHEPGA